MSSLGLGPTLGFLHKLRVDRQIREAMERGDFDDLPGAGKPIPDLDKPHDELWWVKRLLAREGLAITPPTLGLRRLVERTLEAIREARDEDAVRRLVGELNARIVDANRRASSGPPTDLAPVDADEAVRRWRARRDPS